jgi:hypothetical protein
MGAAHKMGDAVFDVTHGDEEGAGVFGDDVVTPQQTDASAGK